MVICFNGGNGNEKDTDGGILEIAKNESIVNEKTDVKYEIEETKAPEGYEKITGKVNVNIKFKKDGNKYLVDTVTADGLADTNKPQVNGNQIIIKIPIIIDIEII